MSPPPDPALPGLEELIRRKRPPRAKTLRVKVGAVSVPLYHFGDGRWAIIYRETKGGKRKTLSFKTETAARRQAEKLCLDIARGQIAADVLSPDERLQAVAARDLLTPLGLSLDGAAREIAGAAELTNGAGILEMARFWARHHANAGGAAVALPELHARLLADLADQDLAPRWRQALTLDLRRFVEAFAEHPVLEITSDAILEWLRKQTGNWRTRNNRLMLVRQFFHFARKKGFLPQRQDTEADKVAPLKRPRGEHSRPGVLSAGELGDVLASVSPAWLPFVALGAFAGMRRAEIERLDWADVRWDERLIHVRQEVAKSTRRKAGDERFVPMREQLLAFLGPWRGREAGPVCTRTRFEDELARLRKRGVVRGKWPKNAFRHTYGSCRMGEVRNMPQVADEMGNSVAEVRRDYRNPRTEREVLAWAALRPADTLPANVVTLHEGRVA